jgi:hypothetical protein
VPLIKYALPSMKNGVSLGVKAFSAEKEIPYSYMLYFPTLSIDGRMNDELGRIWKEEVVV